MNINILSNTTLQVTFALTEELGKVLCGIKFTLTDSGVPVISTESISTNGINAQSSDGVFSDTKDALALLGVNIINSDVYKRILDLNVLLVLLNNFSHIDLSRFKLSELLNITSLSTAFKNNTNIIDFSDFQYTNVVTLSASAFERCTNLERIVIPNVTTTLSSKAFFNCSNLSSINIPESIANVGANCFTGCSSIVTPLKNSLVFIKCPTVTTGTFNIDEGTVKIANTAFRGCSSLTTVNVPDTVTTIENNAFLECNANTLSVIINSDLLSLGGGTLGTAWAFYVKDSIVNNVKYQDLDNEASIEPLSDYPLDCLCFADGSRIRFASGDSTIIN